MSLNLARVSVSASGSIPWRLLTPATNTMISKRTLLDKAVIRMDGYTRQRVAFNDRLLAASSNREKYVAKLTEQMANEKNTVFSEDLNTLLTVAETKEDAALAVSMLKRLQAQMKAGVVHYDYSFGPVVMRMFHYLRLPDDAFACYRDDALKDVFTGVGTGTLLIDALYEAGKHQEVVDAYEQMKNKYPDWNYPRAATYVYIAACYKLGTPEAFEKVRATITEINRKKLQIMPRVGALAAMLGVKQKNYDFVTECERAFAMPERSSLMLNVRVLKALEQVNPEQVISILDFTRRQFAARRRPLFGADLIKRVDDMVAKYKAETSDTAKDFATRLESARKDLANDGLLDTKTLEELVFQPGPPRTDSNFGGPRRDGRRFGGFGQSGFRQDSPSGAGFGPRRFGQPGAAGPGRFDQSGPSQLGNRQGGFGAPRQFGGPRPFGGPRRFDGPAGEQGQFDGQRQFSGPRPYGGQRQFGAPRSGPGQFAPRGQFGGPGQFRSGPPAGQSRFDDDFDGPAPPQRGGFGGQQQQPQQQQGMGRAAPRRRPIEEEDDD